MIYRSEINGLLEESENSKVLSSKICMSMYACVCVCSLESNWLCKWEEKYAVKWEMFPKKYVWNTNLKWK